MTYRDVYIAEQTMNSNVEERLRQAEAKRLVRRLALPHRSGLSRQLRLLVCELGYLLVSLGAWMERYGQPQYQGLEGKTSRG